MVNYYVNIATSEMVDQRYVVQLVVNKPFISLEFPSSVVL